MKKILLTLLLLYPNNSLSDSSLSFYIDKALSNNLKLNAERKAHKATEQEINISAIKEFVDIQPGDVISTESDSMLLQNWIHFTPSTKIELGIKKLVDWYRMFYKI